MTATNIREKHMRLYQEGGSLEMSELDRFGEQYKYDALKCLTAAEVDEWWLKIQPRNIFVDPNGSLTVKKCERYQRYPLCWRRLM
jgi:hypothetical protein